MKTVAMAGVIPAAVLVGIMDGLYTLRKLSRSKVSPPLPNATATHLPLWMLCVLYVTMYVHTYVYISNHRVDGWAGAIAAAAARQSTARQAGCCRNLNASAGMTPPLAGGRNILCTHASTFINDCALGNVFQ